MFVPRSLVATPRLFVGFLQAINASAHPIAEIDGYPEYGATVDQLDESQKQKIREVAQKIIAALSTNTPVVGFAVQGHADVALRKPQNERAKFEQEVSQRRANAAQSALLTELLRTPKGTSIARAIPFTATGFGSRMRKHVPKSGQFLSEAQMRENRRVEFFLAQTQQPPSKPESPNPSPSRPEIGTHWRIQILGGSSISTVLPPPAEDFSVANVTLFLEITDLDRKKKARFRANATGSALPGTTFGPPLLVQSDFFSEGDPKEFRTTGSVELDQFVGSVQIFQDPGAGVSVLTVGGNFGFGFSSLERRRRFTRPSLVSVPAGSNPFAIPKASLGFVPVEGTLKMTDEPKSF